MRHISRILVMQHEDQLLTSLNTSSWSQRGRRGGLEMAFWYLRPLTFFLSVLQFKIQAIQTHHHCSCNCCSISWNICFKHRVISHQTLFLWRSCFTLKASFFPSWGEETPSQRAWANLWVTSVPLLPTFQWLLQTHSGEQSISGKLSSGDFADAHRK